MFVVLCAFSVTYEMATSTTVNLCRRQKNHALLILAKRFIRNTRIKHFDIPPDVVKPLPPNYQPLSSKDFQIPIPPKIKRDSLDILKALGSTVGHDPHGVPYMYTDDTYMLPTDNLSRRNYMISKASGRRVAEYMINKYPKYVKVITEAQPSIPALEPKSAEFTNNGLNDDALLERVSKRRVSAAYDMYRTLKQEGTKVSADTHLKLLDLLCVYNSTDPPDNLQPEEFWFRRDLEQGEFSKRQFWNAMSGADEVFSDLDSPTGAAYNTYIHGLAKYKHYEKAMQTYEKAKDLGFAIDRGTYEALLSVCHLHVDLNKDKFSAILDMMEDYQAAGHPPTLSFFNAAFDTTSSMFKSKEAKLFCADLLAEMRQCNIEPSLGTWHCILKCYYSYQGAHGSALSDIVTELEKQPEVSIRHPLDVEFFFTAMSRCEKNLHDVNLAYRIDALLNKGDPFKFLGNGFYQMVYYASFFRLVCSVDEWENVMHLYNRIIPHIFAPNPNEMKDFLNIVDLNEKYDFLPTLFTDLVVFGLHKKADVLELMFKIMASKSHPDHLQKKFGEIALEIKTLNIQEQNSPIRVKMTLTGALVGYLMQLACRVENLDLALYFLTLYQQKRLQYVSHPSPESLESFVNLAIEKNSREKAVAGLAAVSELSYPQVTALMEKILNSLNLEASDRLLIGKIAEQSPL